MLSLSRLATPRAVNSDRCLQASSVLHCRAHIEGRSTSMTLQTTLSMRLVPASGSVLVSQDSPVRVFVLSDRRLLRDSLARVLRNQAAVSYVRAERYSLSAIAEIIDSAYDILLTDPSNRVVLYSSILHQLPNALPHLKVISIDMEADIDELLCEITSSNFGGI